MQISPKMPGLNSVNNSINNWLQSAINLGAIGTIKGGAWNGSVIGMNKGGTNANLSGSVSNGGIFYSTASSLGIVPGSSTGNNLMLSTANGEPFWSTSTWPNTTTLGQILFSLAANNVGQITTGNKGVLTTNTSGVPSIVISSGSFTPTLSAATTQPTTLSYSQQTGYYFQIGPLLFFSMTIQVSAFTLGSGAGNLKIGTLPIIALTTAYIANATFSQLTTPTGYLNVAAVNGTGTAFFILQAEKTAAGTSNITIADLTSSTYINLAGFYFTN